MLTLLQAGQVTSSQITAAVNAVLAGLATDTYALAEGWTLDLVAMTGASALVAMALNPTKPSGSADGASRDPVIASGERVSKPSGTLDMGRCLSSDGAP